MFLLLFCLRINALLVSRSWHCFVGGGFLGRTGESYLSISSEIFSQLYDPT